MLRIVVPSPSNVVVCSLAFMLSALPACSGDTGTANPGTGGRANTSGGAVGNGGSTVSSGGSTTISSGGAIVGTGGSTPTSGGAAGAGGSAVAGGGSGAGQAGAATSGGSAGTAGQGNLGGAAGSSGATSAGSAGLGGTSGGTAGATSGGSAGSGGTVQGGSGGTAGKGGSAGSGTGGASGGASGGAAGSSSGGTGGSGTTGDLWVSPTGADTNPGTQASPLKTLQKASLMAVAGTTIWMMAGTHSYDARIVIQSSSVNTGAGSDAVSPLPTGSSQNGTSSSTIKVFGVAGTRPVIDFQPQKTKAGSDTTTVQRARGILVWANFWHFKNLEIKNAADNCVHIAGSDNTFENIAIHDCGDSGLQITVPEALGTNLALGARNKIINCDSYRNFDAVTDGENADGFAAKDRVGPGNEFRGCRSWQNADDGWDFFYANQPIVLDNCWAFDMKHPSSTGSSDGNGFKLGGQRSGEPDNKADHRLSKCFAFSNPAVGFDLNNNTGNVTCTGCGAWGNSTNFESGVSHSGDVTYSTTPAQAIAAQRGADGSLPDISTVR